MTESVDWGYHLEALDPPIEQIVLKARAAILEHHRRVMDQLAPSQSAASAVFIRGKGFATSWSRCGWSPWGVSEF